MIIDGWVRCNWVAECFGVTRPEYVGLQLSHYPVFLVAPRGIRLWPGMWVSPFGFLPFRFPDFSTVGMNAS